MTPNNEEIEEALTILECVLSMPSVNERDTRVKRRTRVEIARILSAEDPEG